MMACKVTEKFVKDSIKGLDPDSHKGENGKIMVVGGSPLFHGAGRLAARSTSAVLRFISRANDMVYFCTTKENLEYLKSTQETFIGITRNQFEAELPSVDVILVGPGMMRESEPGMRESLREPEITKELTIKALKTGKTVVLDAGALHVLDTKAITDLRESLRESTIITPHREELSDLFGVNADHFETTHDMLSKPTNPKLQEIGDKLLKLAEDYQLTILLKGPIDLIAGYTGKKYDWMYSAGGNPGMTKGGTGDVLAGVVAAVAAAMIPHTNNLLEAAAISSYILKRTGERLWEQNERFFDATDLVEELPHTLAEIISSTSNTSS